MPDQPGTPERAAPGVLISKSGEQPEPIPYGTGGGGVRLPDELYEDRALIVLALRLEGYCYDDIAAKTGLSKGQIQHACMKARRAGKLRDVIDLIDNEAVPQAAENLVKFLRDGDKEATFKVLEGRGVLRRHSNNRTEGGLVPGGVPPLQINILSATGGALPTVIVNSEKGSVVGTPYEDA